MKGVFPYPYLCSSCSLWFIPDGRTFKMEHTIEVYPICYLIFPSNQCFNLV